MKIAGIKKEGHVMLLSGFESFEQMIRYAIKGGYILIFTHTV